MGYFIKFDSFNPISGELSNTFTYLPAIARRARTLLRGRSVEEIKLAAEGIDWAIDEFFNDAIKSKQKQILQLKTEEIERILMVMNGPRRWKDKDTSDYEQAQKYCCFQHDDHDSGNWIFDSSNDALLERTIEESLGIPNSDNTDALTALKLCLEFWNCDEVVGPDFPNGKSFELFAVLALWKLSEAMERLRNDPMKYPEKFREVMKAQEKFLEAITGSRDFSIRHEVSCAAESAIQAMDSIGYAEHLFMLNQVHEKQTNSLNEQKEEERSRRSMAAVKLNIARHQKNNVTKARVLEIWQMQPDKFSSAEKAGRFHADELLKDGLIFAPRTVTNWIRSHAKQIGVQLR